MLPSVHINVNINDFKIVHIFDDEVLNFEVIFITNTKWVSVENLHRVTEH